VGEELALLLCLPVNAHRCCWRIADTVRTRSSPRVDRPPPPPPVLNLSRTNVKGMYISNRQLT